MRVDVNDALLRIDLRAQRRFLHRRRHDVGGQRQICSFHLEVLRVFRRPERFDLTPVQSEHIRCVADRDLRRVQTVDLGIRCERRRDGAHRIALVGTLIRALHQREECTLLRSHLLVRHPQRRLCGGQRGAGSKGIGNHFVQLVRLECFPPFVGHLHARDKALRLTALCGSG